MSTPNNSPKRLIPALVGIKGRPGYYHLPPDPAHRPGDPQCDIFCNHITDFRCNKCGTIKVISWIKSPMMICPVCDGGPKTEEEHMELIEVLRDIHYYKK